MNGFNDRLQSAPFVRILIPFITGIILAELFLPQKSLLYYSIPIVFTFLLIISRRVSYKYEFTAGLLVIAAFLSLGYSITLNNRYIPKKLDCGNYNAVLDEFPVEKGKSYRAVIRLTDLKIKVLGYFEKSEALANTQPGTVLFFEGCPELIENYGNPFEFDYKGYSLRKRIGHRIYLKNQAYHLSGDKKILSLQNRALLLRERLLKRLADNGVKGQTFHVISAITLGARDNIDPETTESFTRTGTLHVLAVSGGNVAVIFLLLNFLFSFLKRSRTGLIAHTILILTGIWGYALITGLSPSVLRAALMFSLIVAGNNFSAQPNIYNNLAASAFILLCINPSLLFDVGFQLSYAAVTAIVFLHPIIYSLGNTGYRIINWLWILFSVSLAAQIGTLPFSLYYFHQFPSYFWLSNMVVVPMVSVLIYFTLFVTITLPLIPFLGIVSAHVLNWIGDQMLAFLQFVEKLPFAVIEKIYPSFFELMLIILAVTSGIIFLLNKKRVTAILALSFVTLLLIIKDIALYETLSRKEIIVFNIPGKFLLAFTNGKETFWLTSEKQESLEQFNYFIKPYAGYRKIKIQNQISLSDTILQQNMNLVVKKDYINFKGLKIRLANNNDLKNNSFQGIPKADIVLITDKSEPFSLDIQSKFPESIIINPFSPLRVYGSDLEDKAMALEKKDHQIANFGAIKIMVPEFSKDSRNQINMIRFKKS